MSATAVKTGMPKPVARAIQLIAVLGIVVAIVDMLYSGRFGMTIDYTTMVGLSAISLGSGFLMILVVALWRMDMKRVAQGMCGVFAICFAFNVVSNMGVATSTRMGEVQRAHQVAGEFKDKTKARDDAEHRLKIFDQQLASLQGDFRQLTTVKVGEWTATAVPASVPDLDGLIAAKKAERDREAGRVKCGPKCERRDAEWRHLKKLRGVAVQIADVRGQIEATKRVLADARTTVETADAGISGTANQSTLYAKWLGPIFGVKVSDDTGISLESVQIANEGMGIAMAFVIAVASAGLNLAGAWPSLMTITPHTQWKVAHEDVDDDDGKGGSGSGETGQGRTDVAADRQLVPMAAAPPTVHQAAAPNGPPPVGVRAVTMGEMNLQAIRQRLEQSGMRLA